MSVLLLILCGLYAAMVVVLSRQLEGLFAGDAEQPPWEPLVSVIIAIRNEAPHLAACLDSLVALDYPADKLEIFFIDDDSSDGSDRLLQAFCTAHPQVRALYLARGEKTLPGKAGAVYAGICESRGEVLFVTDADCQVPPGWIRQLLAAFTPEAGLVGGLTLLDPRIGRRPIFAAVQALDGLYLLGIAAAAIRLGKPLSWMGNNMAFRRSAYLAVGGYPALGPSLIEDFALLDAISRSSPWQVRITTAPGAAVTSLPVTTLPAFYYQRRRWALGIRQVRPFGKLLMAISYGCHLATLAVLVCGKPAGLLALMILWACDWVLCRKMTRQTGQSALLRHFPAFELFYFAYSLILPPLLLFDRRIRWKDQNYPAHPGRAMQT